MKQLQQGKKKLQKGFTLIELMIVVAVIGVLAAIAIPQYQNYVKKAALGSALATATALKTNVEDYIAVQGSFPSAPADVQAPTFSLGDIDFPSALSTGEGTITTILDQGPANTAGVQLDRTADGVWSCTVITGQANITNVTLNGCP